MNELMNLPNAFIHTIYKQYVDTLKDKEKSEEHAAEQAQDEIEEAITGG